MSTSYTVTSAITFTVTHARHLATKVGTDLKRIQRFYAGNPTDTRIAEYEAELVELLRGGYLDRVTYGFQRDGIWIEPTLNYKAAELSGAEGVDSDPGRIRPGAHTDGASFTSFLYYSVSWSRLTEQARALVLAQIPIARTTGQEPGINGTLVADLSYSAGGRTLARSSLRSTT